MRNLSNQPQRQPSEPCRQFILKWSVTAIWNGTWPSVDAWGRKYPPSSVDGRRAGQQLANGYYGCLVQLCGDLDYYATYLDVPRWSNHSKPCSQCKCSFEGALSWLDNRAVAQWQNSLLTPHNWKTHWESNFALFELPGMSACSVAMDLMHSLFLGWLHYVYGSVLSLLVLPHCPLKVDAFKENKTDGHIKNTKPFRTQ